MTEGADANVLGGIGLEDAINEVGTDLACSAGDQDVFHGPASLRLRERTWCKDLAAQARVPGAYMGVRRVGW